MEPQLYDRALMERLEALEWRVKQLERRLERQLPKEHPIPYSAGG
jgi:hypothetical protein